MRSRKTMDAVDRINDRYGEVVVYIGSMHGAKGRIDDSISFGSTGDVEALYAEEEAFQASEMDEGFTFFEGSATTQ